MTQPRNIFKSRELNYIWNVCALLRTAILGVTNFNANDLEVLTETQLFNAKVTAFK